MKNPLFRNLRTSALVLHAFDLRTFSVQTVLNSKAEFNHINFYQFEVLRSVNAKVENEHYLMQYFNFLKYSMLHLSQCLYSYEVSHQYFSFISMSMQY